MQALDIAEVARRSGTPASTIRFYEEKGLVASIGRRGARRLFGPSILERLALIALGQAVGFSLDEIGRSLGVTRERVRQLETRALRELRAAAPELAFYLET